MHRFWVSTDAMHYSHFNCKFIYLSLAQYWLLAALLFVDSSCITWEYSYNTQISLKGGPYYLKCTLTCKPM